MVSAAPSPARAARLDLAGTSFLGNLPRLAQFRLVDAFHHIPNQLTFHIREFADGSTRLVGNRQKVERCVRRGGQLPAQAYRALGPRRPVGRNH
jgi:hypothetical protein